ncbi:C40 family peptidase [Alicyclobacillus dauci]|uniref:C40 family peptidase n=1 Tax=Alicyclobacillus dauci TaxID=1475485 RepID=A0ABY6Z3A9_9BACL|nr:C40 family peptidase [Alicyclobacillus dauci]WAH36779.1 C40 family peptidase [Alicyclobacillus dauci]
MNKKVFISLCTSTICASVAVVTSPLTAFASVHSPTMNQKAIVVNQDLISKPSGFVYDNTTYMPIWYLMQALDKLKIHSVWANHTWTLTAADRPDLSHVHVGTGSSSIYVNGHLVQKVNEVAAEDPASGKQTTYMPAWYIMQIMNRLNIHSTWNGETWEIHTASQSPSVTARTLAKPSDISSTGQQIVDYAEKFIGTPYRMGGESASGFDCSGFSQTVFAHFNISLPRTAAGQAQVGQTISKSDLQPGDLVFFNTDGTGISHVGIYVGDGKFISATSSKGVQVNDISDPYYWGPRFVEATNPGI